MAAHLSRVMARIPSRTATVLFVAAAHGLVLWLFWRVRMPIDNEVETFASVMFFIPEAVSSRTGPTSLQAAHHTQRQKPAGQTTARTAAATAPDAAHADGARQPPAVLLPQSADSGTAITLPAAPGAKIDWSAQLEGAARTEIDNQVKARKQLRALTRRFEVDPDPRNPGRAPASTFRWYAAGIHRIDTRGPLPVLHLNDHCALLLFIIPACLIGHIETHGDLFDGAAAAHGDRLATAGPNDVP